MGILQRLSLPVIAAPMAGGPSTPQLVTAVARAGGLGFLAGGTITPGQLKTDMAAVAGPYAVNLFAPQEPLREPVPVETLLAQLRPIYREHGLGEPAVPEVDFTNGWEEKFAVLLDAAHPPAVVSSTFGPFTAAEIAALHQRGIEAWITVTRPADARNAAELGADALVVQGPEAGGHRSTWDIHGEPDQRPLEGLLPAVAAEVPATLPLVAAGGISTPADVRRALALPQVAAASCGTAFLRATEAGTSVGNRAILDTVATGDTVTTRAFSGRFARGVATDFTRRHPDLPPSYPFLNPLMKPLRKDPRFSYCLAGIGAAQTREAGAADILADLAGK